MSFQFLCVSCAFAGSFARVGSSSLEIPTRPPHTLWTDFECVLGSTFDCILAACGSKMGVLIGWQSARAGLRSEWELDDDRLQCFNIGEESKKERKGKWERRCKRVLLSDNFFVAFNSYDKVAKVEHKSLWVCIRVLLILRTILSHCLCEARLDAMIPVSLAEMTAQWAPCLTNPRHIFISYHFMALPTFSHQTRWSVQVLCHVVSNGNGCEKSFKKNDAEKQRSNRGVQAVRVSVKLHRSHRWSCSSWRLTGATRHRMSWGLCRRTILKRAAE